MATYITSGHVGKLDQVDTSPTQVVGTKVCLSDGGEAIYVQALSEISTYAAVSLYANNTAQMLTTTTAVSSKRVGFADAVSVASGAYAWVRLSGRPDLLRFFGFQVQKPGYFFGCEIDIGFQVLGGEFFPWLGDSA